MSQDNIAQGVEQKDDPVSYLKQAAKTDIGDKFAEAVGADLDQGMMTANLKDNEVEVFKWQIKQRTKMFLYSHPPKHSKLQGKMRYMYMDDTKEALSNKEIMEIQRIEALAIARLTLSRNAKQQELIKEQRRVHRREIDNSEVQNANNGGGAVSDIKSLYNN